MTISTLTKSLLSALAATACFAVSMGAGAASAQTASASCGSDLPLSGTITFNGQSVSVLVGVRWGKGVLTLNDGTELPFSANGVQALESGVRLGEIEGEVYGLTDPLDFVGQYYGTSTGIVPLKGDGDIALINSECVVITARTKSTGVVLSAPREQAVRIQFR